MSALPTAGWESRSPRAWRFTAAVIVLLGIAAGLLAAGSAGRRLRARRPVRRGRHGAGHRGGRRRPARRLLEGARDGARQRDRLARRASAPSVSWCWPQPLPRLADPPQAARGPPRLRHPRRAAAGRRASCRAATRRSFRASAPRVRFAAVKSACRSFGWRWPRRSAAPPPAPHAVISAPRTRRRSRRCGWRRGAPPASSSWRSAGTSASRGRRSRTSPRSTARSTSPARWTAT